MHPLVAVLGGLGIVAAIDKLIGALFPTKIFISYYYDKDRALKRLLKAWNKNEKFDVEFEDVSADVSLTTRTDQELQTELTKRIQKADVVLVLVGSRTHTRKWVSYEIKEAVRLSKPIVAVKQKRSHLSPKELKGVGANWVYGFQARKIINALKECS